MARRRCVYWSNTQRIRIRLRGVIIQTCDTYGGHEKKPRAPLRQSDVTAASSTCGAMPRALRRPLNAPLRMSTRMCGAAAGSYHPTRPTREPRRAPWPLQSSAGCRSNPPGRGDLKFTRLSASSSLSAAAVVAKRQNWWATLATSHPRISDCLVVLLRILTAHQFSVESRLSRGLAHAPAPDEPP